MTYGFEVDDQIGSLTGTTTRLVRFVASGNIPEGSTSTYTVSLSGLIYEEAFMYFEPFGDNPGNYQTPNSRAPTYSISGTTMTITAFETGGSYYVGIT